LKADCGLGSRITGFVPSMLVQWISKDCIWKSESTACNSKVIQNSDTFPFHARTHRIPYSLDLTNSQVQVEYQINDLNKTKIKFKLHKRIVI
jgi:hypothetical protein